MINKTETWKAPRVVVIDQHGSRISRISSRWSDLHWRNLSKLLSKHHQPRRLSQGPGSMRLDPRSRQPVRKAPHMPWTRCQRVIYANLGMKKKLRLAKSWLKKMSLSLLFCRNITEFIAHIRIWTSAPPVANLGVTGRPHPMQPAFVVEKSLTWFGSKHQIHQMKLCEVYGTALEDSRSVFLSCSYNILQLTHSMNHQKLKKAWAEESWIFRQTPHTNVTTSVENHENTFTQSSKRVSPSPLGDESSPNAGSLEVNDWRCSWLSRTCRNILTELLTIASYRTQANTRTLGASIFLTIWPDGSHPTAR